MFKFYSELTQMVYEQVLSAITVCTVIVLMSEKAKLMCLVLCPFEIVY
jgi:hypothetical protein